MADQQIKITVGADTSQLNAELTKAQNNLKQFQAALAKSTNVKEIEYLQRSIKGLENQIGTLSGNLGNKLSSSSNTATYALTNLSRVVQDAPYGFIGIANNLNPLLESFQRLRAESTSSGQALKALGSSLLGPAGVGIALSVITGLLLTNGDAIKNYFTNVSYSQSLLQKSLTDLGKGYEEASLKIFKVTEAIKLGKEGVIKKSEALKIYNQELGDAFGKTNDLTTAENLLNSKAENFIKVQGLKAQSMALFSLAAQENAKYLTANLQDNIDWISKTKAIFNAFIKSPGQVPNVSKIVKDLTDAQNKGTEELKNNAKKATQALTEEANNLLIQAENLAKDSKININLFDDKKIATSAKKAAETIDSVIKQLRENLRDQIDIQVNLNENTLQDRINLVDSTLKKLISDFNINPNDKRFIDLKVELNELQLVQKAQEAFKKVDLATKKFGTAITIPVLPKVDVNKPITLKPSVELDAEQINQIFTNTAQDIAVNFGETLGAALAGTASIGDFFGGLFQTIGKGLQAFGKYMIQTAIKIELIKKSIFSNTALAIAGGIALIAIGALLNQKFKTGKFAVGTNYAPGGMALVGERGPELVSLPRGSQVVPAAQTSNIMKGAAQQVEVFGVLRGQDIYFSNKKYSQTYRRTT